MSFSDDYYALRKKRKKDERGIAETDSFSTEYAGLSSEREELVESDYAPVRQDAAPVKEEEGKKWYEKVNDALSYLSPFLAAINMGRKLGEKIVSPDDERTWFQKGAFADGYQFGDITKTILGTTEDSRTNAMAGVLGMGEKAVDAAAHVVGSIGGFLGDKEYQDAADEFAAKDLYDEEAIARKMAALSPGGIANHILLGAEDEESYSVLGEKSDSLVQSGGELAATVGLQYVGVPWYVTSGVTAYGAEVENALRSGASHHEAGLSAAISAGAEILTEKLFGGSGLGEKGLIDLSALTRGISGKLTKALADFGLDMAAEGSEEVVSQFASNLASKLYREERLEDILFSEEAIDGYIESFIGGAALGGVMNTGNVTRSIKTGRDYRTGNTQSEQTVVDKEIENRIKEAEEGGKTLTDKQKAAIEEQVLRDFEKGYISTDAIESTLGGDTYTAYQKAVEEETALRDEYKTLYEMKNGEKSDAQVDRQAELKGLIDSGEISTQRQTLRQQLDEKVNLSANGRFAESYNERARRGQAFEADLSKYDVKQQKVIQKAIDSGILNNTNRTHEFVDMIAKISADKGVSFDFTNNAKLKESGFAVDGAMVNGYVTKDGVTVNIQAAKSLNSVVGHEITHVLEGTEVYTELQNALFAYSKAKGDYQSRLDALTRTYANVKDADVKAELTADLVGDYLFTDADFVNQLSVKHRNVFQKIYDEIKYLYKVATAGSQEARELERVKKVFDQAYKQTGKASGEAKYSLSDNTGKQLTQEQADFFKDSKVRDENGNLLTVYHGTENGGYTIFNPKRSDDGISLFFTDNPDVAYTYSGSDAPIDTSKAKGNSKWTEWARQRGKGKAGMYPVYLNITNPLVVDGQGATWDTIPFNGTEQTTREIARYAKENGYDGVIFKNIYDLGGHNNPDVYGEALASTAYVAFDSNQVKSVDNVKPTADKDIRYSLSAETDKTYMDAVNRGDTETAQKMVDEAAKAAGYTVNAYHGTQAGDFTVFDKGRVGKGNDQYGAGFYFTTDKTGASHYGGRVINAALDIKNPIRFTATAESGRNLIDAEITLTSRQAYEIVKRHPDIYDAEESPLGDYFDEYWEVGAKDWMIRSLAKQYRDVGLLDSDLFRNYPNELHEALRDVTGYDGVEVTFERTGEKFYVAWFDNQMKSTDPVTYDDNGNVVLLSERFNTNKNDIRYSLSRPGETPKAYGNFNVRGEDIALETAPVHEDVAPAVETEQEAAPVAPTVNVEIDRMVSALWDKEFELQGYRPNAEPGTDEEAQQRLSRLTDRDAPPEREAPYYGDDQPMTAADPFLQRDWDVRGAKAFTTDNPDAKPFFQEAAEMLAADFAYTQPAERGFSAEAYYDSGGEKGFYGWSRKAADDINTLMDVYGLSYAQIAEGLDAIIHDTGKVNNKPAKTIELILNDRLLNGYKSWYSGEYVPPNQGYIEWLNGRQNAAEYAESAAALTDADAPPVEDIAPVAENAAQPSGKPRSKAAGVLFDLISGMPPKDALAEIRYRYNMYAEYFQDATLNDARAMPPKVREQYKQWFEEKPFMEDLIKRNGVYEGSLLEFVTAYQDTVAEAPVVAESQTVEDVMPIADAPVAERSTAIKPPPATKEPRMARATPAEQATAQILTDEPKAKKKPGAWSWVKEHVLDRGMVFENLALKTGNRELQARWNSIRRAEGIAQKMVGEGNAQVRSLKSMQDAVQKTGKTKSFYEYLYHLHNVDRMTLAERYEGAENKTVFGDAVTADVSREAAAKLEKANPEFKQYAKDVYAYNTHLRELLVEGGVISRETAKLWEEMYPHYVPIRRAGDNGANINVPLDSSRTGINAPIKRATGGNSDILPLFDTMAMRTMQTYKAISKNRFGVELKNTLGTVVESDVTSVDEVLDSIDAQEELLQEGKNGQSPTFTVFEDGKRVKFEITEEMYEALKPSNFGYTNKTVNRLSNIRRGVLTEYNPWFLMKNAIKDVQDILINSQHPAATYGAIPKAIYEMSTGGRLYQEYMDNGGDQNTYFDNETGTFAEENKALETAKKLFGLEAISKANNIVERLPRLAEYIASREAGRSVDVAMLDAARVTTNFAAGGDLTKMFNRNGFTFLNASVQGAVQQARNIREAKRNGLKGWAGLAARYLAAGLPALLLNHLLWDDDEEYAELSDYVKQNYYIVGKYGDGKFVRIPKGRATAVIQNAFEQMENLVTGNDEVDLKTFLDLAVENLAPSNPAENNLLAPIFDVMQNKTWYGEDLVPTRLQDVPAAEQYDESTDAISKWLGETTGTSPYKWNYLLDQYSGVIGDTFLPMLTPEAENGVDSVGGELIAPLADMFTTDSVMKNQNVSDFYDKVDELAVNANSSKATDEDVLKYKYINSVNAEMGELYKQKREIQNSGLSDAEKYEQVRDIQKQIDEMAKESLNTYGNVTIQGGYATVGDRHYRWYEPGEDSDAEPGWQKLTDKQLEKQNNVTSGLGITPSEYWSNKEEYDFAYEKPEKYALAKAVGGYTAYRGYSGELYDIKADKDASGKSISGSRKEKVIEYINNLDAGYEEKIVLFKSEYPSDDTYNYEIVEYLNNRNDISYEEMEAILKELGFTVYDDGTITWD